jgi:hypothetical protein
MEKTERKSDEMILREGALELCIDRDHITISVDRFTELMRKEVQLDIVQKIYLNCESYSLQDRLSFLFGPVPEKGDDNA